MLKLNKNYSCCFTGHRQIKKGELANILEKLNSTMVNLIDEGITNFIAGGATGFDTLAAGCVLNLKRRGYEVTLALALPCEDQSRLWSKKQQSTYEFIRSNADSEMFIEKSYTKDCMRKRNDYMIENAAVCISYLRRERTGTSYTVNRAYKKGLEVIEL